MNLRLFIGLNILAGILLFISVPWSHAKMLLILFFALSGWSMKVISPSVVSLIIIVLIPLFSLGTFEESLSGFSKPFVWLLVSAFVFSAAMEKTGIGRRIAFHLLAYAKGNTRLTVPYLLLALIMLGFFIPTSAGRTSTIVPVCLGIIEVIKDKRQSANFAKAIMIGVTFTSSFICWGLLTGSNSSIYAAAAIHTTTGYKWNYVFWFLCNFPIMVIAVFCLLFALKMLFPLVQQESMKEENFIDSELELLGPMKKSERRVLFIGGFILGGWMTEPLHGLSVPLTAMIGAILSCLPILGVQKWKEASTKISWDAVILFGAGFAIADAIQRNQTASWLALLITEYIPAVSPFLAASFILSLVLVIRLGFAEMLAITATLLPITISLAEIWLINPVWLAQIMLIACSFGMFFPFQSTSNLLTYSYGFYTEKDFLNTGILLVPALFFIILIGALFYWPLIGLKSTL
jgi:anion transporter